MEELTRMMNELSSSLAALNAMSSPFAIPDDNYTISDDDGIVAVSATRMGRITAITVKPTWQDTITSDELTVRVNSLVLQATFKAMGMEIPTGSAEQTEFPEVSRAALTAPPEQIPPTQADHARADRLVDRTLNDLLARVDSPSFSEGMAAERFYTQLDQLDAALSDEPTSEREDEDPRFFSENRAVSAALTSLGIGDIQFREGWADGKSGNVITTCLAEVLDQIPQTGNGDLADALRAIEDLTR